MKTVGRERVAPGLPSLAFEEHPVSAHLFKHGNEAGTHFAGPTWESNSGAPCEALSSKEYFYREE